MRFFFEEHIGSDVMPLSAETTKHVGQVLRMKIGDQLILTNGKGTRALVEINELNKRACGVRVLERDEIQNPNPDIHLAISFTKNNARMEWLLEKITEIGVRSIYPILTQRSERSTMKTERYNKKLIAAMLQSQQYHLPVLHEPRGLHDMMSTDFTNKFMAHCVEDIERKNIQALQGELGKGATLVAIGPEGDFTLSEIEEALQHNFKSIHLGNNRLRTETAGLVAVTLLHHYAQ